MSTFEHPPMPFAARQIRLLSAARRKQDNLLHFSLTVFDFDDGEQESSLDSNSAAVGQSQSDFPPYGAFSYTWGTPSTSKTIMVNNRSVTVTASCYYALEQVSQNSMIAMNHYWIDSICINQSDLLEKASQVAMMGSIYRRASKTFACVGAHCDDSQLLMHVVRDLDFSRSNLLEVSGSVPWQPACDQAFRRVLEPIGDLDTVLKRLVYAVRTFRNREYWNRLWIVQELRLSRSTLLLCGSDAVPLLYIARFESHFLRHTSIWPIAIRSRTTDGEYHANKMEITVGGLRSTNEYVPTTPFWGALQTSYAWKCADPRDRVYGLLDIVAWPLDIEPLRPDYTISSLELARRCLPAIVAYLKAEDDDSDPINDWGVAKIVAKVLCLSKVEEDVLVIELRSQWASFEQTSSGYSVPFW